MTIALILVEIFTVIMQRNVCEKAFDRKPAGTGHGMGSLLYYFKCDYIFF